VSSLQAASLAPPGFVVESAVDDQACVVIRVRSDRDRAECPKCNSASQRIHSRYLRGLADLPIAGRTVKLLVLVRRFRCDAAHCVRQIFAERFDPAAIVPWARRTARLDQIVHCLGLALGGRPAAAFADRLRLPVSNDTLLRLVRRRAARGFAVPTAVGIDDWAWRRNHRYGTLVCDLERRKTIALLPDREPATAAAWLAAQPQITVVARDRGGGYARAAQQALPNAVQVADRWHLMENASHAFLDAVAKCMRPIRAALGATIDPALLTAAERLRYESYRRREDANAVVLELSKGGLAIKEIVRRTGFSRGLVRNVLRGQRADIFRTRQSALDPHLPWLDEQWAAGVRNGAELWRRLKRQGFSGSLRVVAEWTSRRRKAAHAGGTLRRALSARTIARLMTVGRDRLSKAETLTVAAIESGAPMVAEARDAIAAFQTIIRTKAVADLDPWLDRAKSTLVASFANGVVKDRLAVRAAIALPWSNGQTEGQITKLKLVKRQMYGRGKLDLLQARVIGFS
jgi:transposase